MKKNAICVKCDKRHVSKKNDIICKHCKSANKRSKKVYS